MDTTIQPFFTKNIFATCFDKNLQAQYVTMRRENCPVYNAIFK